MKKFIALLLAVAATFLFAFSAVGCSKKKETETPARRDVVFDGFEEFEKDFLTIRFLNNFGKININYDEKYVKFGKGSAKIEPSGGTFETATPTFVLPTVSARYGYDYSDFSKTEKISAWFYNDEEKDLTVGIGLQKGEWINGQWWDKLDKTNAVYYTLKSGWNYIEYLVEPQYLACQENFDVKNVQGLFFEFEYADQFADVPVIYMDDLRLHFSENEITGRKISLKADAENGVWEVSDFENAEQTLFWYMRASDASYQRLNARIVNASKYNTVAASGYNVLEVVAHPSTGGGWPRVSLSANVIRKVMESIGQDVIDNPNAYEFKFDYFNASPVTFSYQVLYLPESATNTVNPWQNMNGKPYAWQSYSINLSKINETLATATLKDGEAQSSLDFVTAPCSVVLSGTGYNVLDDSNDRVYLVDNFRIEKIVTGAN